MLLGKAPKHQSTLLFLLLALAMVIILVPQMLHSDGLFLNSSRIIIVMVLAYILVFSSYSMKEHYQLFKAAIFVLIPVFAVIVLFLASTDPIFTETLVREDTNLENFQAVFLFTAASIFLVSSVVYIKRREKASTLISLCFLVLFFAIGMEEISWMQRILEVESNEFFVENNMQSETNVHNLHTHLFQNIYLFSAFLFLILVPFFREQLSSLLQYLRRDYLEKFLPSRWLLLPFSIIVGFVWPSGYTYSSVLIAFIITVFVMVYEMHSALGKRNYMKSLYISTLLMLLVTTAYMTTFQNSLYEVRNGAATEYTETFIAFGMLVYAVDFYMRNIPMSSRKLIKRESYTSQ